ncbi:hypothetical protein [Pelagibius sp.]|uniref:hypothetical protein n=1 Tax=Pelagibius sp. TaxID=1931238 RepID=UPI003BB19FF9
MVLRILGLMLAGSAVVFVPAATIGLAQDKLALMAFLDDETPAVSDRELELLKARGLAEQGLVHPGGPREHGVILWDELKPIKPGAPQPTQAGQSRSNISTTGGR